MLKQKYLTILLLLFLLVVAGTAVLAQTSPDFDLSWHALTTSGGGQSTSADYHVQGTIGQALVSPPSASSTDFVLSSGYGAGITSNTTTLYLPLISVK